MASDEDEFAAGLAGLAGLVSVPGVLEETLRHIAGFAVQAIPGAQGAGLTLLETDRPQTVVATDEFVREVDEIQYGLWEGPCVSAVDLGRTVTSGNLGGDVQWPRFGPRVGRLGVHSALSLPLLLPGRVVGAMNIYARGRDVFGADAVRLGEAYAGPAAVSVANAQLLAQAERLAAQLQTALASRAEIDQAIGVLMSRNGSTAEAAMGAMRRTSQAQNVRVADLAKTIVADATALAKARRARDAQHRPPVNPSAAADETPRGSSP